jgi:predicted TIM-barrel fold metal-dependent hydrolase
MTESAVTRADPVGMTPQFSLPPFRFVDTHVHLFDHGVDGLAWGFHDPDWEHPRLKGAFRLDAPKYSVPQYRTEVRDHGVVKMVHVQAVKLDRDRVAETSWLQGLADVHGWPNAIVGPAVLADPSAPWDVERQAEYANFRGVRDTGDPARIDTPEFDKGVDALAAVSAVCEVMITLDDYDAAIAVARRHPDVTFVLEHAGLPVVSRLDGYFARWRQAAERVAELDNFVCKISALSSGAPATFFVDGIRRWVLGCIECFGLERCMFASNWPIDKLFVTYEQLLAAFKEIVEDCSPSEQEALFATNAERVYRI